MSERRRFNDGERASLFVAADGLCVECGTELLPGWHADHKKPYSKGGTTTEDNGQATCPTCNLKKSDAFTELRDWQQRALNEYQQLDSPDFVAHVCPAAGKTRWAGAVAHWLLSTGRVERVVVIVPASPLRRQWADSFKELGLALDPDLRNRDGRENRSDFIGCVLTYQQVASRPGPHRVVASGTPTLVVFDEIHHAGDQDSWGDSIEHAFGTAARRLALTGTLFRTRPGQRIPFVSYNEHREAVADFPYEYGQAVADGVCRTIDFLTYDGEVRWIEGGLQISTSLASELEDENLGTALESAFLPDSDYMRGVLRLADANLRDLRQEVPNAAGLVVAYTQERAKEYERLLLAETGQRAVVVVSEDADADARLAAFRKSSDPWIIAVAKVSEGVDIPRLAIGVWATKIRTRLFFRQVVGRFVRRQVGDQHNAVMYLPAIAPLIGFAEEIERLVADTLEEIVERAERESKERDASEVPLRMVLTGGDPQFDRLIRSGQNYQDEYVHARALCEGAHIPEHYVGRLAEELRRHGLIPRGEVTTTIKAAVPERAVYEERNVLKGRLNTLAKKYAIVSGQGHQDVNVLVNAEMGVYRRSDASVEQLRHAIGKVEQWLADL